MTGPRDTALAAHDAGICVVPPQQDGTKAPIGEWKQYQATRPTRTQVETWYSDPSRTGVGFIGGAVSGGLELFEFEGRAVEAGIHEQFVKLATARGLKPLLDRIFAGYLERSPSDGIHTLYRCDETGNHKLAKRADGRDLIETKGEGGYMIVAPSNGKVHPTGRTWRLITGGVDTIATITAEERRQLHDLAAYFDERIATPPQDETHPSGHASSEGWVGKVVDAYNTRTTWRDVIAGKFTFLHERNSIGYWHYEGADNHVSATTNATGNDTLIVFSGTAEGAGWRIWTGRGKAPSYDRFSAHVLLTTGSHSTDARVRVARQLQAQGYGPPREGDWSFLGDTTTTNGHQETPEPPQLDHDEFWNARPELTHIRTYAQAQMSSPWAVLGGVLARVVCQAPTTIVLPAIIEDLASINLAIALVGRSGDGKGGATSTARRAVDIGAPQFDTHTLGSGQGIAHGYGHWENGKDGEPGGVERHADSVLFIVEEVDHLGAHAAQTASTTLAELRRFVMGEKLGHLYVDRTRRVEIREHTYRGAFLVGVQPARAGAILGDADGGTPQRFVWLPVLDPHPPDTEPDTPTPHRWRTPPAGQLPAPDPLYDGLRPIPVCDTAAQAVRDERRRRSRGQGDPLDGHRLLCRERVAAALGLLHGHYGITDDDWQLSEHVMAVSDTTRTAITRELEAKRQAVNRGRAHDEAERDAIKEDRQDQRVARRLLDHLRSRGDWVLHSDLRRRVTSRDRVAFESAIDKLIAAGVVETEPVHGRGTASIRYRTVPQ